MKPKNMIKDKQQFQKTASQFFNILFAEALKQKCGDISIEVPNERKSMDQTYHNNVPSAVNAAYQLCQQGLNVYVGVNPRVGSRSQKSNIHWLTAFHAEVDYGQAGHNTKPEYDTYDDALAGIKAFQIPPTLINHSGGGFHCYWVLNDPANVSEIGLGALENVNRSLLAGVKADIGTHNINRVLRVPSTFNFKIRQNPRPVTTVIDSGPTYDLDVFRPFIDFHPIPKVKKNCKSKSSNFQLSDWDKKISSLPVSAKIQFLIINGNDGSYTSRSEADQAVITALMNKNVTDADIKAIFENYMIGEKYRGHASPNDYLKYNIKKAKEFSHLTEEERQDLLFISGALHKDDKGKYHLKIVPFQEFMNKKHMLKFLEKERAFFRYNGQCYEQCSEDRLNNICQTELEKHRELFTPASKANFIHFAIGNDLVDVEKAFEDQIRYLTLQNYLELKI